MKGDFTRRTFRPENRYSSVRMQQGRVQLDADWNEQVEIQEHLARTQARDLLGPSGVPAETPFGFQVRVNNLSHALTLGAGRIYVEGTLCELPNEIEFVEQPDYPDAAQDLAALPQGRLALVYLEVWDRQITALEDPEIVEPALGGPSTATRTRTMWRAKLRVLGSDDIAAAIQQALDIPLSTLIGRGSSEESILVRAGNPGEVPRGNHLLRVEIHQGALEDDAQPTAKWALDNASHVTEWRAGSDSKTIVVGRGVPFAANKLVELLDDGRELSGRPGELRRIVRVDDGGQMLELDEAVDESDFDVGKKKVRLWEAGDIQLRRMEGNDNYHFVELTGSGLSVAIESGPQRTGNAWLIPIRQGAVHLPQRRQVGTDEHLVAFAAEGPRRVAKLAVIRDEGGLVDGVRELQVERDLREAFEPIPTLVRRIAELRRHVDALRPTKIVIPVIPATEQNTNLRYVNGALRWLNGVAQFVFVPPDNARMTSVRIVAASSTNIHLNVALYRYGRFGFADGSSSPDEPEVFLDVVAHDFFQSVFAGAGWSSLDAELSIPTGGLGVVDNQAFRYEINLSLALPNFGSSVLLTDMILTVDYPD